MHLFLYRVLIFCFCGLPFILQGVSFYAFDWDNNLVNMPTPMMVKNSKTGKIEMISTTSYRLVNEKVPGYEHLSFFEDSFRYNHDDPTGKENYFLNDIKTVLADPSNTEWKGPDWETFVKILSKPETASHALIITAREQSSHLIRAGLLLLQEKGFIKYVMPEENIWAVNHPKFYDMIKERMKTSELPQEYPENDPQRDPTRKFFVINYYLNQLAGNAFDGKESSNNSSFMSKRIYDQTIHSWYFSDDSEKNILTSKKLIQQQLENSDSWKNLRIEFHYTSSPTASRSPYRTFVY